MNGPEETERARESASPRRWRRAGVEKVGRRLGAYPLVWVRPRSAPGEGGWDGLEGEGGAVGPEVTSRFLERRSSRISLPSPIGDECNPLGAITVSSSSSLLDFRLWMFVMSHLASVALF